VATSVIRKPKLVVFDVEGVIIPKNRFFFEMGKHLGHMQLLKIFLFGFLYEIGLVPLKSALQHIFSGARGMKTEMLTQLAKKVHVVPDAKELFNRLEAQGCITALVSSGLPTSVVKLLADEVGADYAFGFDVGVEGDTLTGEIRGDVIEPKGKLRVLQKILSDERINRDECAVVADDRNNASIFLRETRKIGYNPDYVLRVKADTVVTGRVLKVLPVINGQPKHRREPSLRDVSRELIHASGIFVPIVASLIGIPIVAVAICLVLGLYMTSELLRAQGKKMPIINYITRKTAAPSELYQLVLAPAYFALGILFTLLIFPVPSSSAAIAIFSIGDSSASIFGGLLSKKPLMLNKGKTIEGSLAGFILAAIAGAFFVTPWKALVGAIVAMTIEVLPLPVNDNLLMPLCTGLALTLVG